MIADKTVKYNLFISAILRLSSFWQSPFSYQESLQAWAEIVSADILFKAVWRPGQDQYGILAMVVGSVAVTIGAFVLGFRWLWFCHLFRRNRS
jgi:ABC-type phosphate transport system permease subunit